MVCAGLSFAAMAQLSTGKSTSSKIRTGNRAQEGDFGLYIGANVLDFSPLPLVNLKYMGTDELEFRLGIELKKNFDYDKGDQTSGKTVQNRETDVENAIYPGVAYHFSNSNILDVYVGAELPLGYGRINDTQKFDGDDNYRIKSKFAYNIGFGGFVGLQAYIANLPLAVGLEYGIFSRYDFGMKYKIREKASAGSDEVVRYAKTDTWIGNYDKLSVRKGSVENQVRVTVSYFFTR